MEICRWVVIDPKNGNLSTKFTKNTNKFKRIYVAKQNSTGESPRLVQPIVLFCAFRVFASFRLVAKCLLTPLREQMLLLGWFKRNCFLAGVKL
jgi:hypothetical protein